MDRSIGTLVFLLAATSFCYSQEYFEWNSTDGEFALEAELYELLEDEVLLKRKENGKVAKVPIDKLSDKDKEFLESSYGLCQLSISPLWFPIFSYPVHAWFAFHPAVSVSTSHSPVL